MVQHKFKKTIGSKREVWNGTSLSTGYGKSGLKKKDLMRVKRGSEFRIVSRKQHMMGKNKNSKSQRARSKWTDAVKKARKELIKERVIKTGEFIPILKRVSSKYNASVNKSGRALYRRTKSIYENKTATATATRRKKTRPKPKSKTVKRK
jgi:hypothetical protein